MKTRPIIPIVSTKSIHQLDNDAAYWQAQPYLVRMAALEEIRQEYHRWKNDAQPGLQRVYRIIKQ